MTAGNDRPIRVLDWTAARTAEAVVRFAAKSLARRAEVGLGKRVSGGWIRPAVAVAVPSTRNTRWWRQPFMGTGLSRLHAGATFAGGPIVWIVADLAWAALPA